MNDRDVISVALLAGVGELAGATDGQAWFLSARRLVDQATVGVRAVDFSGIRLATVSWLREGLIALVRYARTIRPGVILVVANLSDLVREELVVALQASGEVCVDVGDLDGGAGKPVLLGSLDAALREALTAVEGEEEFDASVVRRSFPQLAPSAASNRLAALESKGVLTSERRGRTRVYRPLMKGLRYGN